MFGFGWGWLVACFVPYSIVFFFTSFPYVFFYTLLGKIVVIKRKKCVSKIRRWIAALPLKIHLKTIPLHFEYKVISSTYGYLKMANNVNTIAYLGGAFMYVYILQAPVIKRCKRYKGISLWSIQVHCQSKYKAVNQTQSGFTCYRYKFWFLHKNSHVWHVRVLCNYHYSMGTLLFVCFLKYLLYFFYLSIYLCMYIFNQ